MYKKKLLELGIPAHIKGFDYLNYALMNCKARPTMKMYSEIAAEFSDTTSRVERAIRHAISFTGGMLPNAQFIATYQILWEGENGRTNIS